MMAGAGRWTCRLARAALAVGMLLAGMTTGAAAERAAAAYPPAGTPAPAAPCARTDRAPALDFYCRFLTQELWQQAGQPEYIEAGGRRWQVWFYGRDGATHQLLVEGQAYLPDREGWFEALFDVGSFDAETYDYFWDLFRYAPWSVQFLQAGGCTDGHLLNPAALASERFRRRHVLGLGWPGLTADPADPARAFGAAALSLLLPIATLPAALEPVLRAQFKEAGAARAEVTAFAAGRGRLWPDYARDGGVWLVDRDGMVTALDDLEAAAARLAAHGLLVTNDAMRSWESGLLAARDIARARGPLLYLYFAQDPFLPVDPAGPYTARLRYLLAQAAGSGRGTSLRVVSHGRSAGVVAHVLADHPAIAHEAYAPAAPPLDTGAYIKALRHAIAAGRIDVAAPALPMEAEDGAAAPVCFEL